ncbi:LysR family transcriptional regulator [Salipiger profundus]|uniref:LysR family transcriptional regulator n=1 Tax=Salipiger profundus TaxID=1229727 RepID=UPI0008EB5FE9|nr:LysR family transcriptional regulator [Salipiger profundus]SFB97837.1 DNA-binding transcriptional regulator, LysR family [Salipiger profundus]
MERRKREIEIRHLRCFVNAADHGSFRKAGSVMRIRQSSVSRCIRDLEDRLGTSLFHRHRSGVSLNRAGHQFLPRARQTIRGLDESLHAIALLGRSENGRIKIGIYSSIASGFLAELLRSFGDQHNDVQIQLIDGNPEEHLAAIRQLELDVAFLTGTRAWQDCDSAFMWSEGVFVVLPERHELAILTAVDWHELSCEAFMVSETAPGQEIYDYLVRKLADLSCHPDIHVQSVSRDNLLSLVAIGRGLTVVSEAMTATNYPGLVFRPIKGERLPFSAIWSPNNDNPAFRRLLSMARAKAELEKRGPISGHSCGIGQHGAPSRTRDPWP